MKKTWFKNSIIVLSAVSIFFGSFVFTASAANYDYQDYIVDEGYVGDNTILTASFPEELAGWNLMDYVDDGRITLSQRGTFTFAAAYGEFSVHDGLGSLVQFIFNPLSNNYMKADNVPNGSTLTFDTYFWYKHNIVGSHAEELQLHTTVRYYDSDYNELGRTVVYDPKTYFTTENGQQYGTVAKDTWVESSITTNISKPAGTKYMRVMWYLVNNAGYYPVSNFNTSRYIIEMRPPRIKFTINTDYLANLTNKEVADRVDKVNDSVQEVISGTPEQNNAANSMNNQMNDSIAGLESAGDALESVEKPDISGVNLQPDILGAQSYLGVVNCINSFWDNPAILAMASILAIVMLIAVVLFGLRR